MVVVMPEHRIAYMAVPKAGSSSVKSMLARIDHERWPALETDLRALHQVYPTKRFRPHRWRDTHRPGWFGFTVLRDPLARLMSVYTDRVIQKGDLRDSHRIQSGQSDLPADPDPDHFFANLPGYMAASSSIKHHALPTVLFTGPDLSVYDAVFRTEEISELARHLSRHTGHSVAVGQRNASAWRLGLDDLSAATRDVVRDYLAPDYDLLADHYPRPF